MDKLNCDYFTNYLCRSCSELSVEEATRSLKKLSLFKEITSSVLRPGTQILPLFQASKIFPSRSKAKLSITGNLENPIIGLVDKEFKGIELLNCPLHLPCINKLLNLLPEIIKNYKLVPYNIAKRTGELKGVIVNSSRLGNEMMLRFVLRSTEAIPRIRKAIPELQFAQPNLKVVSANIQAIPNQVLEGPEEHLLTEESVIWETYNEFKFAFAPQCFSQVTPETAEALYLYVQELVKAAKPKLLLDLYCGVGGFALFSAKYCEQVIGIENSPWSIACAKKSAKENGIADATFIEANSENFAEELKGQYVDSLICNPPRRGLSKSIVEQINKLNPKDLIYSSCNLETLVRDIALLDAYELKSLAPFEMFPLTKHLEVVAHLQAK